MGARQSKRLKSQQANAALNSSNHSNRHSSNDDSERASTSNEVSKKRFILGKKKIQNIIHHDSHSCTSASSTTSDLQSIPVDTTVAKSPTINDQEQDARQCSQSISPCVMEQPVHPTSDSEESIDSSINDPPNDIITPPISLKNHKRDTSLTSQDLVLDLYLGPDSDSDRKKEKDRQQRLHYLLKKVWRFIYRADLKDPELIVHWCCGIGIWDMEMAGLFPNAKVVGIDFKEATFPNLRHGIPNLDFKIAIIQDSLTGLESFEDNTVDYVLMRDAWIINAPAWKWENVLKQIYRVLKPGGSIELSEHTLEIKTKGPYSQKMKKMYAKLFMDIEVDFTIAHKLGGYLKRAGFDNVDEQSIGIPLGEWSSSLALKEMGYLFKDLIERRIRGLEKWVAQVNHISIKEVNEIVTESLINEVDLYHAYIDWFSYTAKKPID